MKKFGLILIFMLIPAICFGEIEGPKYEGGSYEKYSMSAKNTWTTADGLKITLDYEHYSQRAANAKFVKRHFDGEKYIFNITGLKDAKIKNIEKRVEYHNGSFRGILALTDAYKDIMGFNSALSAWESDGVETLRMSIYTFEESITKIKGNTKPELPVSFVITYKDKTQVEIRIPFEVTQEIIAARSYVFDKANKEKLREEWNIRKAQDKEKNTELLAVLNDPTVSFLEYSGDEKETITVGIWQQYQKIGTAINPREGQEWEFYSFLGRKPRGEIDILIMPKGEVDSKKSIFLGELDFGKKKETVKMETYLSDTEYIVVEKDTVLSYIAEAYIK
jgi:hypothetical protein